MKNEYQHIYQNITTRKQCQQFLHEWGERPSVLKKIYHQFHVENEHTKQIFDIDIFSFNFFIIILLIIILSKWQQNFFRTIRTWSRHHHYRRRQSVGDVFATK